MKKWTLKDKSSAPGGGELSLYEHDGSYSIRINGHELMSTRRHASEEALAALTCKPLSRKRGASVLIGGLGFGFSLRAALAALGKDARVVVAEIFPAVVLWNRDPAYPLAASSLADRRVEIVEKDVAQVIRSSPSGFDAILLDVDNGPSGLSVSSNEKLYRKKGLILAKEALRPGGRLGVWSAQADARFAELMEQAGFAVEVQRARPHTLFLGRLSS